MTGSYVYPVATRNISDTFTDHVLRGSVNPGTDYTAAWGSPVWAVNDGYIGGVVGTFGGSGGRMIYLDLDDGSGVDYLHLSQINVDVGQRVHAGDLIGYSGASGNGSEWYYGAHLHISIRPTRQHHAENYGNYDFDAFMRRQPSYSGGGATPIPEEFVMKYQIIQAVDNPTLYLTGPGITFAIPNTTWLDVLSRWAAAMNANKPISLTKGQWDIVAAATRGGS